MQAKLVLGGSARDNRAGVTGSAFLRNCSSRVATIAGVWAFFPVNNATKAGNPDSCIEGE